MKTTKTMLMVVIATLIGMAAIPSVAMAGDNRMDIKRPELISPQPFFVLSTSPKKDATYVPTDSSIVVTFSKMLDKASNKLSFVTVVENGTKTITGTVVFFETHGNTMTFDPQDNLKPSTIYTVIIDKNIKDSGGNKMASDFVWSFKTDDFKKFDPFIGDLKPDMGRHNVAPSQNISGLEYGVIDFPDKVLKKAVIDAVKLIEPTFTGGDVTTEDCQLVDELAYMPRSSSGSCDTDPGKKIKSLEGLQYCPNIKEIALACNEITDLAPLKELVGLTNLNINHNKISDISPIQDLTKLQTLDLEHNQIKKLNPLIPLSKLKYLYLSYNPIASLSPLVVSAQTGGLGKGDIVWLYGVPKAVNYTSYVEWLEDAGVMIYDEENDKVCQPYLDIKIVERVNRYDQAMPTGGEYDFGDTLLLKVTGGKGPNRKLEAVSSTVERDASSLSSEHYENTDFWNPTWGRTEMLKDEDGKDSFYVVGSLIYNHDVQKSNLTNTPEKASQEPFKECITVKMQGSECVNFDQPWVDYCFTVRTDKLYDQNPLGAAMFTMATDSQYTSKYSKIRMDIYDINDEKISTDGANGWAIWGQAFDANNGFQHFDETIEPLITTPPNSIKSVNVVYLDAEAFQPNIDWQVLLHYLRMGNDFVYFHAGGGKLDYHTQVDDKDPEWEDYLIAEAEEFKISEQPWQLRCRPAYPQRYHTLAKNYGIQIELPPYAKDMDGDGLIEDQTLFSDAFGGCGEDIGADEASGCNMTVDGNC